MKRIVWCMVSGLLALGTLEAQNTLTFQLDMNGFTGNFTTPEVNGTFNGWCGSCNPMSDPDGDNIWEAVIPNLMFGTIEYKFSYDNWAGQELLTPGSPCTITTGTFTNRTHTISGSATLPVVCWGSCSPCSGGPQSTNVTFNVDMRDYTQPYTQVFVTGDFNNWCGICNELMDPDGDSIYSGLVAVPISFDSILYKFEVDNFTDQESLLAGDPCTFSDAGFTNRKLVLTGDTVVPAVCWGSCQSCTAGPTSALVTFKVDMSTYTGSYTQINLNGTFNNWCGSCAVMLDPDNDLIFEIDVTLPIDTIQYKFTADGWTADEQLTSGAPCTFTDGAFVNRIYNVTGDTELPVVCWARCDACQVSLDEWARMGLNLFPNPGSEGFTLTAAQGQIDRIWVRDVLGRTVAEVPADASGTIRVDASSWPSGAYIVEVAQANRRASQIWMKSNRP